MKLYKIIMVSIILLFILQDLTYGQIRDENINRAMDAVDTKPLEEYLNNSDSYLSNNNIDISDIIGKIIRGEFEFDLTDYIKYQIREETGYFTIVLQNSINILLVCIILTIINYFSDELNKSSVSDIVLLISIIIVVGLTMRDINAVKVLLQSEFTKIADITQDLNSLFLSAVLSIGKLGVMQFFYSYSNYIIGITTKYVYYFADIVVVLLITLIIINNLGNLIKINLLYKLVKKGALIILSIYIFIVVINFSVQGYILYKTDNIFISSVKALAPTSIPILGSAVNNFFGIFVGSLSLIKDVIGFVVIFFIISLFGSSLFKILITFVLYKITAALSEPFNEKISKLLNELTDVFYIYFISLATPVIIITIYYSVLINFLNNLFG